MILTTSELIYINEAAKALKQKEFVLINNVMIGLDNIQNIVTFLLLDNTFFVNHINGVIINQRELSAFVKTISLESDFKFGFNDIITTISGGTLNIRTDHQLSYFAFNKFKYAISLDDNIKTSIIESEIPDIMVQVQSMKTADGSIGINYNGYYMTLFPALVPSNKSDKLYVTILQPSMFHIFISKFRIKKKKFDIITYISYLKV